MYLEYRAPMLLPLVLIEGDIAEPLAVALGYLRA